MYPVSDKYLAVVAGPVRKFLWHGTITCKDGTVYTFDRSDISSGGCTLTRSVSGGTGLELGSVYASELTLDLYAYAHLAAVTRYQLYGAVIDLKCTIVYADVQDVSTWAEAEPYTWDELSASTWSGEKTVQQPIDMGLYEISECMRELSVIKITAYDNMTKFDKAFGYDTNERLPYDWLMLWCSACGVALGMTAAETYGLANGTRKVAFSNVVNDADNYRDALSYLAAMNCSVAMIDRSGKLVLKQFKTAADRTVPASWRFSSTLSDFVSYYSGMYATYKETGESEYYHNNTHSGADDGLVYDIGTNPFLQITNDTNRAAMAQHIMDTLARIAYAPFSAELPLDPSFEPMDVLQFSGNQAGTKDRGAITEIVYNIDGTMTVKCAGENPKLNAAQSRWSKNISGLSDSSSSSGTAWLLVDTTTTATSVTTTDVLCNTIDYTQTDERLRLQIAGTLSYTLDEPNTVTIAIKMDGSVIYTLADTQTAGEHYLTFVTADIGETKGEHEITMYAKTGS